MTLTVEQVHAGWAWQREICRQAGSVGYVGMITAVMDQLGRDPRLTELLTSDTHDPVQSAQCLRLLGAVNRVALAENASWITDYYPVYGGQCDVDRLVPAFLAFLQDRLPAVRREMSASVQTNEVGRAAPLSAAINYVAEATGMPVRLLEVGASAGLNLLIDRYFVAAGDRSWGPPRSALRLTGQFKEGDPPAGAPEVVERRGCDLNPIDARDPRCMNLLRSFVWPEHVERMTRLNAALDIARSAPAVPIDADEACSWASRQLATRPAGQATVLYHSMVLTYFDDAERAKFADVVRAHGAGTPADRPLAWISMEPSEDDSAVVEVSCELWPDGRRLLLARCTPHGGKVRWAPAELPA
ncbi:DUF2332 domain-containing protein [Streptomyces sp. Je 1-369]|uniref:DUF2332 domain-containing protein n=1 Tax=Streptomyces sp. Je 1-369 TaxID=2966192 RepID=UPI002286C9D3|nr:DUF2332 domain-containing protein [Streptomyces sp. Je 1-369]WAL96405.1 DUF2332 domain-containing protein [Streptomyces sp. Je 1-369]